MDFSLTDEQILFKSQVLRFCREQVAPFAEPADRTGEFSFEAFRRMGEFGLLGLHYPPEYGGQGADVLTSVLAGETMGYGGADGGLMLAWGAHTYLCGDTILQHGTEEQRRKYLPKIAGGEWIGAMGLTEPGAGSDAASISTSAVRKGDKWILNGSKIFITNGPIADVIVVYACNDKSAKHLGVSAFVIEKGFKGFSSGPPMHKLGVRSSQTSELFFDDCEVPLENQLGPTGAGFLMALQTLEWDRSTLLSPMVGSMTRALEDSARYAVERKQFGRSISEFYAIQSKLADMRTFVEAARLLVYRIAWSKDQGRPLNHLEASIAKLFVGDWGMKNASEALQLHGGYGYMHEFPVERVFRDAKLAQIGGGTSEIQRTIIARILQEGGL